MRYLPATCRGLVALLAATLPVVASACTMPTPPPPEQPEIEIEIEYEDYDSVDDLAYYKVEIEVGVVPPSAETICQCALGLGSNQTAAPDSFRVSNVVVGIHGDNYDELEDFAGFEQDSEVEDYVSSLTNFNDGASAYGFSVPVAPFDYPSLGPEDRMTMVFQIAFDPDDFDEVNGNAIQFAAGSVDPGHEIGIFSGYQAVLSLPAFQYSPPGDYNSDGEVGLGDYTLWRDNFGSTSNPELDVDDSGDVDEKEYRVWKQNFGQLAINGAAAVQVPEPGTAFLCLAALAGLAPAARRWRRI